jgi:hypothetical protein
MRYELEFEDTFDEEALDCRRWLPYHLPHWSSRPGAAVPGDRLRRRFARLIEGPPPRPAPISHAATPSPSRSGLRGSG